MGATHRMTLVGTVNKPVKMMSYFKVLSRADDECHLVIENIA